MGGPRRWLAVVAVASALLVGVDTSSRAAAPITLPFGMPPAAYWPQPALPTPAGWPGAESFPRTSGTGRLADGAAYWTDFLYDDHGAVGNPGAGQGAYGTYGVPSGSYLYSDPRAANNGADIFRIAIARTSTGSAWRVDWNTLTDPTVPIIAFGIDLDDDAATGSAEWQRVPDLRAAGTDAVVVLSASHASVHDLVDGTARGLPAPTVDMIARSFVLDVPADVLAPTGRWRVRAAAGLATGDGTGFEPVSFADGAFGGQPPVYNVGFRTHEQEPLGSWRESAQAAALADGDISPFSLLLDWGALARKETTPEPFLRGASDRWFVSSREFGQGVLLTSEQVRAKFLGRVQPYSLYVPKELSLDRPVALTMLLHSFATQHTQFEDHPNQLKELCDDRGSICATPLGRGPDGFNVLEAELDFWEVWNRVGTMVPIDWERTALWGFSMGAQGVYRLAATYPDLFARVALVAGGSGGGGIRPTPGGPNVGSPTEDVNTTPLLVNLRGVPIYIAQGALDELNPLPGSIDPHTELDALGYRHRFQLYPAEGHSPLGLKDTSAGSGAFLGDARRDTRCPSTIAYRWRPLWDRPDLGVMTQGAYWLRNPTAVRSGPGVFAAMAATSSASSEAAPTVVRSQGTQPDADPSPAVYRQIEWEAGEAPERTAWVTIELANVGAVTVDTRCAGLAASEPGALAVRTDTGTVLRLANRAAGRAVAIDGTPAGRIAPNGTLWVTVPAGLHVVTL